MPSILARLLCLFSCIAAWGLFGVSAAPACPICPASGKTFGEEIASVDVAVVVRYAGVESVTVAGERTTRPRFEIVETIKGAEVLAAGQTIDTRFTPDTPREGLFLITAIGADAILWSSPLPLSPQGVDYLKAVLELPAAGPQRLKFVQQYFEHEDPRVARDACDEFSRLPYADVRAHASHMDRTRLRALIQDDSIDAGHRRLYLTMLSVCGAADDAPLLEAMLKSSDEKQHRGLDALIVCYLTLKGEAGMPLIEQRYLSNPDADHAETYAAIMAYRFLGQEQETISRERLLAGFLPVLERPNLADLVIPDFANWEDWTVIDKLVTLFKNSDEKTTWVRVPVVNYLRRCPEPRAARVLEELERLDPDSVRRAKTFFPDVKQAG